MYVNLTQRCSLGLHLCTPSPGLSWCLTWLHTNSESFFHVKVDEVIVASTIVYYTEIFFSRQKGYVDKVWWPIVEVMVASTTHTIYVHT